ncbi:MAG: hypothetical protein AMJ76_02760 [Dehalococcoidia bacterium SM23_28_1]|nr:MAG: hypothetical protein AMJ76_02760 [Dehalococcoidia bacterium SM23_28_1]
MTHRCQTKKAVAAAAAAGAAMARTSKMAGRPSPSSAPAATSPPAWMDWEALLSLYSTTGVAVPVPATGDSVGKRACGGEAVASAPAELAASTVGDGRTTVGDEGGCGSSVGADDITAGGVGLSLSSGGGGVGVCVAPGGVAISVGAGDGTAVWVGSGMVVSSKEMASK